MGSGLCKTDLAEVRPGSRRFLRPVSTILPVRREHTSGLGHNGAPMALLYLLPPFSLISSILARVREQGLSLNLVAPWWPSKH